jgi:hypothetical protein
MNWTLRLCRWHAYIGLFIVPSVLFFAVTGALQIFNLHEAHGSYTPAVVLEKLSAVHKDQVFEEPHDHPPPGAEPPAGPAAAADQHPAGADDRLSVPTLVLKWFFLFVAVALSVSTLIGVWMGATQLRSSAFAWTLLVTGTLIPIVIASL